MRNMIRVITRRYLATKCRPWAHLIETKSCTSGTKPQKHFFPCRDGRMWCSLL